MPSSEIWYVLMSHSYILTGSSFLVQNNLEKDVNLEVFGCRQNLVDSS
jgi:hypothetical protein